MRMEITTTFWFELNTKFTYHPGQTFRFTGDDDLWVFINKQLVIHQLIDAFINPPQSLHLCVHLSSLRNKVPLASLCLKKSAIDKFSVGFCYRVRIDHQLSG